MDTIGGLSNILQKFFLSCGVLAPMLYLGTDLLAGRLLKGYSFKAQSMSELSAAGSPTRSFVVTLTVLASVLLISFGVGIWRVANHEILPRIVGGLLIGNATVGLLAMTFFPTRLGERPNFLSANVIFMFLSVIFFMLAMLVGAAAFKGWFRILSIMIPVTYIILAALRFATTSTSSAGDSGSLIGAQERTMAYSFLLWVLALAIYLLLFLDRDINATGTIGR